MKKYLEESVHISAEDAKFMEMASRLSEDNIDKGGGPFGAVIVRDGEVSAKGANRVVPNNDPTAHAEINAIRDACKNINSYDLSGAVIYTSCYPCPMCLSAIIWANIDKVYYGCNTTDTEIIGFRDKEFEESIPSRKQQMCHEMNRQECLKLYEEYKNIQNKTMY